MIQKSPAILRKIFGKFSKNRGSFAKKFEVEVHRRKKKRKAKKTKTV